MNLKKLKFYSDLATNTSLSKSKGVNMQQKEQLDAFLKELINKINAASSATEADNILRDMSAKTNELEKIDFVNYKHDDYNILTALKVFSEKYIDNLKTLSKLNLSIVPKLIFVLEKENSLYIITKQQGIKNGMLKKYDNLFSDNVSKEAKLEAYHDMQKLTKAGLIDDAVFRGNSWLYTPENKLIVPIWNNLRQIRPNESRKDIMEQYYNIIFGK